MKTLLILAILIIVFALGCTAIAQITQSQAVLAQSQAILVQAETMRAMGIRQFFTSMAMFLLGGFIGAGISFTWMKRHSKPAYPKIHIPQNAQPQLTSRYVTFLDSPSPSLTLEDPETEAVEYESFSGWGW